MEMAWCRFLGTGERFGCPGPKPQLSVVAVSVDAGVVAVPVWATGVQRFALQPVAAIGVVRAVDEGHDVQMHMPVPMETMVMETMMMETPKRT